MTHCLNDIPVDVISKRISELENVAYESVSIEDLKDLLNKLMAGYSCRTRRISSPRAWRARKNAIGGEFHNVRDLWYPPPKCVSVYGRLNRPNSPLMYVSASHHSALLEMRPRIGERYTILQMRLKSQKVLPHVMELGLADMASDHCIPCKVRRLEDTEVGRIFLRGQNNIGKNRAIRSYLAREFTKVVERGSEENFKISVAIAEMLMSSPRIDGVEYPCMAGDISAYQGAANMALKPESADRLYEADACWLSKVEGWQDTPTKGFIVRCVKRAKAISEDGSIQW